MNRPNVKTRLSLSNNQGYPESNNSSADDSQACAIPLDPDFAYADGNIELQILGRRYWIHEFMLTKFTRIAELIRQARDRGELTADSQRRTIICIQSIGKVQCADFQNTFRVIYSSMNFMLDPVPPSFDVETLVSTLRVATLFQNSELRNFAISQLESEKIYTTAIDRIALSDELNLPNWEIPAFAELCRRKEPISPEEVVVLGIARFAEISRIREAEQRRQYTELIDEVSMDPLIIADVAAVKDWLQTKAEQTLKSSSLPACNCGVERSGVPATIPKPRDTFLAHFFDPQEKRVPSISPPKTDPELSSPIVTCQLHQLAPSIASESRSLYRQFSSTLKRVETLQRVVLACTQRLPRDDLRYSVEDELKEASWVRKAE